MTISDEDVLYRRLHSQHINPRDGAIRPNAYQISSQPEQEPSVELARMSDPDACAQRGGRIGWGCGVLRAGKVRELGFAIKYDPNDETDAHCILVGEITMDACRQLADATTVVRMPDMVHGSRRAKPHE